MSNQTKNKVVLDEITLYVHIINDGTDNFPWQWGVTTSPDLPRRDIDGSPNTFHPSVVKWSYANTTRIGSIWRSRKWCRKNAARLAGRASGNGYQRFTYTAVWGVDK